MATETNLTKLNINKLTKAQYLEADIQGQIDPNEIYVLKDVEYSVEGATINDTTVSATSTYSSSKITAELGKKQNTLTAGIGITITDNVISAAGTGSANVKFRVWG